MVKELPPVRTRTDDYDEIAERLAKHFKKSLYEPLAKIIREKTRVKLTNDKAILEQAFRTGRISYDNGFIKGKLNSRITKELKKLGAVWSRSAGSFQLPIVKMPDKMQAIVQTSLLEYEKTVSQIDDKLQKILPEEIADTVQFDDLIDKSLADVDKDLRKSLKSITVSPEFSKEQLAEISKDYTLNMRKWITDWTSKEIQELRKEVQKQALMGKRFESLAEMLQQKYGTSQSKAKFLARQETHLYLAKVKETRYKQAGVEQYKWKTVVGSSAHPVRPAHKALDGKVFDWNNPPITTEPGQPTRRNHPGEDFNCRCYAIPIVRF